MKFSLTVEYRMSQNVEVEADSFEDACDEVQLDTNIPNLDNSDFLGLMWIHDNDTGKELEVG